MQEKPKRLDSIDVFRALTMLLMIFVNDLWSVRGVPEWLGHTEAQEDDMGLADVVFPAFLFIVGLSIPHSIAARKKRGFSPTSTFLHIVLRAAALIIMGVFHVNLGNYSDTALVPKFLWQILITIGFFMVWLDYPSTLPVRHKRIIQGSGIALLLVLAALYRGTSPEGTVWLQPKWWGILGLIGWTYFFSATLTLIFNGRILPLWISLGLFLAIAAASQASWSFYDTQVAPWFGLPMDAGLPVLTLCGAILSLYYNRYLNEKGFKHFVVTSLIIAAVMFAFGFITRPVWGISKILATPSWITICSGISILFFLLMIWLCDLKKKTSYFKIIRPGGTSTLTAYLLPYIHYALLGVSGITLPVVLRTGGIGIIKSLLYALLIIMITGLLEKLRLRLKL